jgi:hypothetical protein
MPTEFLALGKKKESELYFYAEVYIIWPVSVNLAILNIYVL